MMKCRVSGEQTLKRRARVERRLLLALADGSTLTLGPGDCWIDEDASTPTITWKGRGREESSPMLATELHSHLARGNFVFTTW
jgi:hypothetical protein